MTVATAGAMLAVPAYADLDVTDYAPTAGAASAREQAQVARRIEVERKYEAERARQKAASAAKQVAAERARLDARPYPVRITELRCTRCHVADYYLARRYTWLGWSLVTLRMKYLNGAADISEAQLVEIVAYLPTVLAAQQSDAAQEYFVAVAALCTPFAVVWGALGLRRRSGRKITENEPT